MLCPSNAPTGRRRSRLVWYETTYVVLAATVTGDVNVIVCQPLAVSPVNVPVASRWPVLVHRLPVWVPVLLVPL